MGITPKNDGTVRRLNSTTHSENYSNLFKSLYYTDTLTDVTIACKDGCLNTHKMVLAAYSTYFQELLTQLKQSTTSTHLTFIMHKITIENMKLLLEFMYKGTVEIPEILLPELLAIAAELQIKGFNTQPADGGPRFNTRFKGQKRVPVTELREYPTTTITKTNAEVREYSAKTTAAASKSGDLGFVIKDISGSNGQLLMETREGANDIQNGEIELDVMPLSDEGSVNIVSIKTEEETNDEKLYQCDKCTASFARPNDLTNHIANSHRQNLPYQCATCDRRVSTAAKLKSHMRNYHDEEDYKPKPHEKRSMNIVVLPPQGGGDIYDEIDSNDATATQSIIKHVREVGQDGDEVKRKRGRPRTREISTKPKQGRRGRPKKIRSEDLSYYQENYDLASLPYGDFSYLTSELAAAHAAYNSGPEPIFPEPVLGEGGGSGEISDVLSITKVTSSELPTDLSISCVAPPSMTKIGNTTITPISIVEQTNIT